MEQLPYESYYRIIQNLDIKDIIYLCQTNSQLFKICDDPYTWKYLLKSDFNINYNGPNPYQVYIKGWSLKIIDISNSLVNLALQYVNNNPSMKSRVDLLNTMIKQNQTITSNILKTLYPPKINSKLNLSAVLQSYDNILSFYNSTKNTLNKYL